MPKIVFTKHALERMLQRGLTRNDVKDILLNPTSIEIRPAGRKIASRRNHLTWHVVFIEEKGKTVVLTVYSD